MQNILSKGQGLSLLIIYGLVMVLITLYISYRRKKDTSEFLLANRSVGIFKGAMSVAAAWIWAPALFVSSQKAFEQGIAGAFWFIFPNFLALLVFAPVSLKVRKILPKGYTFPQYIKQRHGNGVHVLYMIQFLILQICSFAVQILAGATLIKAISGLSYLTVAISLVTIVVIYALLGGLRASVTTDYIHMGLVFGIIAVTIPWVIIKAGGLSVIGAGIAGITGKFGNIFNPWVLYSFGIPTTIGLLSGPIGDQMHWQRAYSLKSNSDVVKTFVIAAFVFALVPLSLSLLGFVAAGKVATAGWVISNTQMVGPIAVSLLLPSFMLIVFAIMLLSGLCSTLDSILCAVSSLTVVDIFKPSSELTETGNDTNPQKIKIARMSMLAMSLLGLGVALIPNLKIVHLFLFYATLRASTAVPTILTVFWPKLQSKAVFVSVLLAMIFGAPLMGIGNLIGNPHLSVAGSMLTVIIGFLGCYILSKTIYKEDYDAKEGYSLQS